jgi:hypothetical protein
MSQLPKIGKLDLKFFLEYIKTLQRIPYVQAVNLLILEEFHDRIHS